MNTSTANSVITARQLSAGYGPKGQAPVLKSLDLSIPAASRVAIIGPNGSGKTTLLRVIAGVLPYTGSLILTDRQGRETERSSVSGREAAKKIAFLAQISSSYFPYTVREATLMGRYAHQSASSLGGFSFADKAVVDQVLSECGLTELEHTRLAELSGGQLQRVFLARALAQQAEILLLDEMTNHLDLYYQLELIDSIRERTRDNTIRLALGVFHDISLAVRFAETLMVMDRGTIAIAGPSAQVIRSDQINQVYSLNVYEQLCSLSRGI